MLIDAQPDRLVVRLGTKFGTSEAKRLDEAIMSLEPCARLTVDFTDVRDSDDAAFALLADTLVRPRRGTVALRGVTLQHSRLVSYLRQAQHCVGRSAQPSREGPSARGAMCATDGGVATASTASSSS